MDQKKLHALATLLLLVACTAGQQDDIDTPDTYEFKSRFDDASSVSYSGQVFRQLLLDDMSTQITGMTARIADGSWVPLTGDAREEVVFYLDFDSATSGGLPLLMTSEPATTQSTYDDIASGKNLLGKLAGNDETGQHKDWSTEFQGWGSKGATTPEGLLHIWLEQLDTQAVQFANGEAPIGPTGTPVPAVHITPEGQDLNQLIQKFSRMAIAYSQAVDDYLDDDIEGKGLLQTHSTVVDGKNYSALEHSWDEGFGYFGASTAYGTWSDADIKTGYNDTNEDGLIDLKTEVCWGHSINAAKRDLGSAEGYAPTDFTSEAWSGFASGRQLLSDTEDELTADQLTELKAYRDQAVMAWEKAVASTVVHYINDVLQDMGHIGSAEYNFANHAKHWSEMKGFALGLQFNRNSPLSDTDFGTLHALFGKAPILQGSSELSSYQQSLLDARDLLGASYGFDSANMGDPNGENGW